MSIRDELKSKFITLNENYFSQENFIKSDFEDHYLQVRGQETRLYPDEVLLELPKWSGPGPLKYEWKVRGSSTEKLLSYIKKLPPGLKILEVGTGNGWLSARLATVGNSEVLGIDINTKELQQASRVFAGVGNLSFLRADIFLIKLDTKFDCIVLASSLQYFQEINKLLWCLMNFLKPNGEIHIVDSPIYDEDEVALAKQRSEDYFSSLGSPLHNFYFHHTWKSLDSFHPEVLHKPGKWQRTLNRLLPTSSPFPWIKIKRPKTQI